MLFLTPLRKLVSILFLMLFSTQILPVKELGKLLFKSQISEEEVCNQGLPEDIGEDFNNFKKEGDYFRLNEHDSHTYAAFYLSKIITSALSSTDALPRQYVPDILTPPPDWC